MADSDTNIFDGKPEDDNDVLSDIEVLTKKYGLSFSSDKKDFIESVSAKYGYDETDTSEIYSSLNSSSSWKTPQLFYDVNDPGSAVKIVYGESRNRPSGPEGRRVIYAENETESIAVKRRRNARLAANGSQGFSGQPYVKHVAGGTASTQKDEDNAFTRAYRSSKTIAAEKAKQKPVEQKPAEQKPVTPAEPVNAVEVQPETETKEVRQHRHYETTPGEKIGSFFRSFIPWKGDKAKEVIRKLIMNASAIVVLICFGYFVDNYIQHQDELQKQAELKDNHIETETIDNIDDQWTTIKEKYPSVTFPEGMNIKWAELYAKNQDLIGWISIENTNIDSPVMHKPSDKDNGGAQDFYLKRNFYKNDDKYGTPYLDKNNSGEYLNSNNTIYGHNMMDGLSFAQLEKYYTIEGFQESPVIKYSTLYEDYYFKVYAAFITNGYPTGDNNYLFNYNMARFPSTENFGKFIQAIDERKLYDTGVDITSEDVLLTLSTCSYEIKKTDMGRLAVVGRLVRPGEDISVDTSKAVANENIRYPQIWYDEHNMVNPFANAYQWIPE